MSALRKAKKAKKVTVGRGAVRSRSTKAKGEVETSDQVELFPDEPCYVSIRRSKTINLGNYESERIEVGLSVPCQPEKVNDIAASVKEWVDGQLTEIGSQITRSAVAGM
jgi:hypothetical protein